MTATFIQWQNPLAEVMRDPGGVRVGDAMTTASKNLESVKAECLAAMDIQLTELEGLCAEGGRHPTDDLKHRIYDLSNDVVAVAGTFDLAELGQAAFCLCELVDRLRTLGQWNMAAVEVHLSAFRLLRRPNEPNFGSNVIEELKKLTERVATIAE